MKTGADLAGRVVVILGPADPGVLAALEDAGLRAVSSSGDTTVWAVPSSRPGVAGVAAADEAPGTEVARLLTIDEAAGRLNLSRTTTRRLITEGHLEAVHIGRSARVPVDSVDGLLDRLRAERLPGRTRKIRGLRSDAAGSGPARGDRRRRGPGQIDRGRGGPTAPGAPGRIVRGRSAVDISPSRAALPKGRLSQAAGSLERLGSAYDTGGADASQPEAASTTGRPAQGSRPQPNVMPGRPDAAGDEMEDG